MISFIILAVGLILLVIGANWLINGAENIAKRFNISDIVIGFTIVSFGTSAPELIVGIMAALKNAGDITVGNVIGSNIFNLLAVLGITGIVVPIRAKIGSIRKYIPFSVIVIIALFIAGNDYLIMRDSNTISRIDGIILLALFALYLFMNFKDRKKEHISINVEKQNIYISLLIFILGVGALGLGGELTTRGAVEIARMWGVSEKMIALTVIATGTSLPELITSLIAVLKKKPDIAIGNIVGSNIFNVLLILGLSSLIRPVAFNPMMNIDLLIVGFMSLVLLGLVEITKDKVLNRVSSSLLLISFIVYWIFVILRK